MSSSCSASTKEAIEDGDVSVLVGSHVSRVIGRPAERIVWLDVETIGQNGARLKPFVSVNVIIMPFFIAALPRSSSLQHL